MDREKLFEEFLEACRNKQICGQGKFDANILLIGQEPYCVHEIKGKELTELLYDD